MSRIADLWIALDARRKVAFATAAAMSVAAMLLIARIAGAPDFALLYAGLDAASAGEVAAALESKGVAYEVRGDALYVDRDARDTLRISLAAAGLPANGGAGYELLDSLTGFGTTSQMFDAAYQRAREGELARTIVSMPLIRSARVHIADARNQPFRAAHESSASIVVSLARGQLSAEQAEAVRFLVSSAVSGLAAENVSIIDSSGTTILAPGKGDAAGTARGRATDREALMRANLERLLEARVGAGKAVVEVAIDTDMNSETVVEKTVDPASRVAISTDTEEKSESAAGGAGQPVTVASNLPEGDAAASTGKSTKNNTLSRERVNYELSETRTERVRLPGRISRISVAVLVDGVTTRDAGGNAVWAPRPAEELAALEALVKSAAGYNADRGDTVTLQSLQFAEQPLDGTVAESSFALSPLLLSRLAQTVVLGVVALALAVFVVRPGLIGAAPRLAQEATAPQIAAPPGAAGAAAPVHQLAPPDPPALPAPDGAESVSKLRGAIAERTEDSARVLQSWLEDPAPEREAT
ncbi:MAG: flagellar basal-body MS-ring/collar protein FliF [Paracoccaceae bacterium]